MKKSLFLILISVFIISVAIVMYQKIASQPQTNTKEETSIEKTAILEAQKTYNQFRQEGLNLSNGPCLSNHLIPDWALDIAHNPRVETDDLPENQCADYREGKVHHFVELDPTGNLIRAI